MATHPKEITLYKMLDIALTSSGSRFHQENRDVFQEFFILEVEESVIFLGFGPCRVHFLRAFDLKGNESPADFVKFDFTKQVDGTAEDRKKMDKN